MFLITLDGEKLSVISNGLWSEKHVKDWTDVWQIY